MAEDFIIAREDLLQLFVCTSLSKRKAIERLKSEAISGTRNGWMFDQDEELAHLQGSPCSQTPGHVHFIFCC